MQSFCDIKTARKKFLPQISQKRENRVNILNYS